MSVQAARLLDAALRLVVLLAVMAAVAVDNRRPNGRPGPGRMATCLVLFAVAAAVALVVLNMLGLTVGSSKTDGLDGSSYPALVRAGGAR